MVTTCPVCEHAQQGGTECEGCGRRLGPPASPAAVAVPSLPELESTQHAGAPTAAPPPVAALTELERTQLPPEPDWPAEPIPELEHTRFDQVMAVITAALPELERHRSLAAAPTALPGSPQAAAPAAAAGLTCRYCRHVQAQGLLCDRCGMKLPRPLGAAAPLSAALLAVALRVRCRSCGAPAKAGERCGDCGRAVPLPEA